MTGYREPGDTLGEDYAREEMEMRGELRVAMNTDLATRSGIPDARMRWTIKAYHFDVYVGLGYELVGWPGDIVFRNLSGITGYDRISRLLDCWRSGEMHFAPVTPEQRDAARGHPLKTAPAPLHLGIPQRRSRSDVKKRRHRPKTNPLNLPYRYVRDGPKSERWVAESADIADSSSGVELEQDGVERFDDESQSRCFWCIPCTQCGGRAVGPVRAESVEGIVLE